MLTVLGVILLSLTLAGAGLWLFVLLHVLAILRDRPTARAGLALPQPADDAWSLLSIIVPAHNEQAIIAGCVESLLAQDYPNLEVIIVLDRCTDDSASILQPIAQRDERLTVIENDHCPDDWAGKCHAASIGAQQAGGDWLLFTDADTNFDRALCRSTVAIARHRGLALLSLLSTLSCEHDWERSAQPVATMALMRMHPIHRVNREDNPKQFANGQFLLFDRAWYEKIGGHAAVHDFLLEDIAFARHVAGHGGRGYIALADGMLRCAMYDSMSAFREGWKRIFIEACRCQVASLRRNAWRLLVSGPGILIAQLCTIVVGVVFAAAGDLVLASVMLGAAAISLILQYAALAMIYRMGGTPIRAIWMYPLGCIGVARIFLDAASDLVNHRPIRWGGREYTLEPYDPSASVHKEVKPMKEKNANPAHQ